MLLGTATWFAAGRGWLGYRVSGRSRAVAAALVVGLLGPAALGHVVSGIPRDELVSSIAEYGACTAVVVGVIRSVRTRWPLAGPVLVGAVPPWLLAPGVLGAVCRPFLALLLVGVAWQFHRRTRRQGERDMACSARHSPGGRAERLAGVR